MFQPCGFSFLKLGRAILVWVALGHTVMAAELDSWTNRNRIIRLNRKTALDLINKFTNQKIDEAIVMANAQGEEEGKYCDEGQIYKAVYEKVGGFMSGEVEKFVNEDESFESLRSCTTFDDSVYRDFNLMESTGLLFTRRALGCGVNIHNLFIGSDKFGHFFGQGYTYFKIIHLEKKGLQRALNYGDFSEKNYFGLQATGVYSFADLSANYEGLRFWRRLTGKYNYGGKGGRPYITCRGKSWVKAHPFSWTPYISQAWDEGHNCNFYRGKVMEGKVMSNLRALGFSCPSSAPSCDAVIARYGKNPVLAKNLISPFCALKPKAATENLAVNLGFYKRKKYILSEAASQSRGPRAIFSTIADLSGMMNEVLFGADRE